MKTFLLTMMVAVAALGQTQEEAKPATVEGSVVNSATGEPVRNAMVTLQFTGGGRAMARAGGGAVVGGIVGAAPAGPAAESPQVAPVKSDAAGKWKATVWAEGLYLVRATKNGFLQQMTATTVRVAGGDAKTGVTLKLTPQGIVSGRVFDEDQEPVQGAQVMLSQRRKIRGRTMMQGTGGYGQTNENGEFRIVGVQPGEYLVSVNYQNLASVAPPGIGPAEVYVQTFFPGVIESRLAEAVKVAAGQETTGLDIRLQKSVTFRVSGSAPMDPGGNFGALQLVPIEDEGGLMNFGSRMTSRGPGQFEFQGVRPGEYQVVSRKQGPKGEVSLLAARVSVTTQDVKGVTLQPVSLGEVRVKVTTVGIEKALDRRLCRMNLFPSSGRSFGMIQPGEVQEDGTILLKYEMPGRYQLSPGCQAGPGAYLDAVRVGDQNLLGRELDLPGGLTEVTLEYRGDGATLKVSVEGAGEAGTTAVLAVAEDWDGDPQQMRYGMGGAGGAGRLDALRPGKYLVVATDQMSRVYSAPEKFIEEVKEKGARVEVRASETKEVTVKVLTGKEE